MTPQSLDCSDPFSSQAPGCWGTAGAASALESALCCQAGHGGQGWTGMDRTRGTGMDWDGQERTGGQGWTGMDRTWGTGMDRTRGTGMDRDGQDTMYMEHTGWTGHGIPWIVQDMMHTGCTGCDTWGLYRTWSSMGWTGHRAHTLHSTECHTEPRTVSHTAQDSVTHCTRCHTQPRTVSHTAQDSVTQSPGRCHTEPRTVSHRAQDGVTHSPGQCHTQPRTVSHTAQGVTHIPGQCHTQHRTVSHTAQDSVTQSPGRCHTQHRVVSHRAQDSVTHCTAQSVTQSPGQCHTQHRTVSHTAQGVTQSPGRCHTHSRTVSHCPAQAEPGQLPGCRGTKASLAPAGPGTAPAAPTPQTLPEGLLQHTTDSLQELLQTLATNESTITELCVNY
ncbi:uncharacterized protein LOC131089735 isoform X21 [Melospiza georgiana]|uniref:uncharacterized protein LOC131089735 isoform X21 n=1 Tax=Melospiza georgiana TaxID=44398 RepID=UPI0025ACE156|nr:uncharacterized protein LOC131089735 isoform X21 [Melospiza georgiana]